MTRGLLVSLVCGLLAACADEAADDASSRSTDRSEALADTQFVRDSAGGGLLIITSRQKVEPVVPRAGAADPDAPGAYRLLGAREAHERMIRARPPWYVIDVRTAPEYVGLGHIADAALFSIDRLEENIEDLHVRTDQFVLVYGLDTAQGVDAARRLASYGFPNLQVLQGGFGAWEAAGLPIEGGP